MLRFGGVSVSVDDVVPSHAAGRLLNYPNPFADVTTIEYTLTEEAPVTGVRLVMYNLMGQRLRVLVEGSGQPGPHRIQWDGRDETGRLVPSGVYTYRLEVGGRHITRQLLRHR